MANLFIQQTGTANPFNGINVGYFSTPTFADLDGDGDLDAIVGEESNGSNLNFGAALEILRFIALDRLYPSLSS